MSDEKPGTTRATPNGGNGRAAGEDSSLPEATLRCIRMWRRAEWIRGATTLSMGKNRDVAADVDFIRRLNVKL